MAIEHVIIPVDFSEVSIAAVECGRAIAERLHAGTELVSVTTQRYANVTGAALKSLAGEQGGDLSWRVIASDSEDVEGRLVEEVLANNRALWCVGSHGRTAIGELLFGSVSADLVRDAEVPIVVVGPHATTRRDADVLAVALDGSDLAETVLPAAVTMAQALGMHLRLLQVGLDHVPDDSNDAAYLARLSETLPHPERADYDTLYGDPDEQLVSYVERSDDVGLLAMATRGVPAGARLSVPSTAMKVLRRCEVPVLMLHPQEAPAEATDGADAPLVDLRRRVVVGIDTFEASEPAVRWAAAEADRRDAILQVVHTWQIPVGPGSMYGYPIWPDIEGCRMAAIDEVAATANAIAAEYPDLMIETIVAEGGAVQAIEKQSIGAEMVVLGRHHHGRIAKLLLGSTSSSAVHHVDCPLVIIPCEEPG